MTKLSRRINQALAARPRVDAQSLQEEEVFAGFGFPVQPVVIRCGWCKRTKAGEVWFSGLSYPEGQKYTDGICPGDAALYFPKRFKRQQNAHVVAYHEAYGGR